MTHPIGDDTRPTKPRKVTENDDYVAMMQRLIRGLERRAIDDPAIIAQVLMLAQRLAEVVNVTISESADRHHVDPFAAPSMAECAAILGITKQSASDRRKLGRTIIAERQAKLGVASLTMARVEREERERAAAYAAEKMPEWTGRKLRAV